MLWFTSDERLSLQIKDTRPRTADKIEGTVNRRTWKFRQTCPIKRKSKPLQRSTEGPTPSPLTDYTTRHLRGAKDRDPQLCKSPLTHPASSPHPDHCILALPTTDLDGSTFPQPPTKPDTSSPLPPRKVTSPTLCRCPLPTPPTHGQTSHEVPFGSLQTTKSSTVGRSRLLYGTGSFLRSFVRSSSDTDDSLRGRNPLGGPRRKTDTVE